MKKTEFILVPLVVFCLFWDSGFAPAQSGSEVDARFEKLAKELYPKAKQEGGLVVYTVWDVEHTRTLQTAFSKRFPGISATYWQATRSEIITRTLAEHQGKQANVDMVLTEGPFILRAAGAIEPYNTTQANALILHDPTMPVVALQIQALAYNTRKIKREEVPKSWEDVANPKYKGLVALDDPMRAGPLSALLAGLKDYWKDDVRWTNFIKSLKALNVPVHKSTSAMFRLLIAGEYSLVLPSLYHDVVNEKEKGSPVDFAPGAPPVVSPQQTAIYVKAPHPAAAKLFAEWMIAPEGQAVMDSLGRPASRKGFKSKTSIANWGPNVKPIPVLNQPFAEDPQKWLAANVRPVWEN